MKRLIVNSYLGLIVKGSDSGVCDSSMIQKPSCHINTVLAGCPGDSGEIKGPKSTSHQRISPAGSGCRRRWALCGRPASLSWKGVATWASLKRMACFTAFIKAFSNFRGVWTGCGVVYHVRGTCSQITVTLITGNMNLPEPVDSNIASI